jgi:FkbM family methyltransferase
MREAKRNATRWFDQWLLDALVSRPLNGTISRRRYVVLRSVRRLRLAFSDPEVKFCIGESSLRLPLSHELPFYRLLFPEYSQNLANICFHVGQKYPGFTMIDVGANVGDSAVVSRLRSDHPILCLEGEPRFFQLLAENTRKIGDIECEEAFVGAPGDYAGTIRRERGNATVQLGSGPGAVAMRTLSDVLSRHPRFANATLIKLDAEGFDCKIIAAEAVLLRRNKPVLFFEYYPHACQKAGYDAFTVFSLLLSVGYATLLIYQNCGPYFMTLNLDQLCSLQDLHHFLVSREGYCDIAAFHNEDRDLAAAIRAAEQAGTAGPVQ